MTQLVLKRASMGRPSGEWNEDDYDVLANGIVVGRIFKANATPVGMSWMWTRAFGHHQDRSPTHGYAPTRGGGDGGIREEVAGVDVLFTKRVWVFRHDRGRGLAERFRGKFTLSLPQPLSGLPAAFLSFPVSGISGFVRKQSRGCLKHGPLLVRITRELR
jgi:hypothetical protein